MNQKKIIGIVVAIVVVIGLAFATVLGFSQKVPDGNSPSAKESSEQSSKSSNEQSSPSETRTSAEKKQEKEERKAANEKVAEKVNEKNVEIKGLRDYDESKAEPVEGFTEEEIQKAAEFITTYSSATLTNTYFLSGEWFDDGHKIDEIKTIMSPFYGKDGLKVISKLDTDLEGEKLYSEITPYVFFIQKDGLSSPSESCKPLTTKDPMEDYDRGCVEEDIDISNITYDSIDSTNEGESLLRMNYDAEFAVKVNENSTKKDRYINVKYNTTVALALEPTDKDGDYSYKIEGFNTEFKTKWKE